MGVILLLYPTFGPTGNARDGIHPPHPEIKKGLKESEICRYHKIFVNNNKALIKAFFKDSLIRKLWALTSEDFLEEDCYINKRADKDLSK